MKQAMKAKAKVDEKRIIYFINIILINAMNSFIRDASSILERTIKFNTKLDPYTTNEIWHRWIKMET